MLAVRIAELPAREAELGPPAKKKARFEEGGGKARQRQDGDEATRNGADCTALNGSAADEILCKETPVDVVAYVAT